MKKKTEKTVTSILPSKTKSKSKQTSAEAKVTSIMPSKTKSRRKDKKKITTETKEKTSSESTKNKMSKKKRSSLRISRKRPRRKRSVREAKQIKAQAKLRDVGKRIKEWYETHGDVPYTNGCVTFRKIDFLLGEKKSERMHSFWKAKMTCPKTKEVFECGRLRNVNPYDIKETEADGILYRRLALAKQAALARALDCFEFREREERRMTEKGKRRCEEPPFLFGSKPVEMEATASAEMLQSDDESTDEDSDDDSDDDDDIIFSDDDDEEYTLQFLPGTTQQPSDSDPMQQCSSPAGGVNPMARILRSWNASSNDLNQIDNPAAVESVLKTYPEHELQEQIENAQHWLDQATPDNKSRKFGSSDHRVMLDADASSYEPTLNIVNSMLQGLAKAHVLLPWRDRPRGVEQVAKNMVDFLWSTKSAHPNAETYVAYLKCLEASDPETIAQRAETLLNKMKEGDAVDSAGEKTLPKPTIDVINTCIQLLAQAGRRYDLDDISDPNRETFLSVLSSMSFPPSEEEANAGGFDPTFAQEVIDKMQKVSEQHPSDPSFRVDCQIYNAPLRWSGGGSRSRPYARPIPWDSHAKIFENGFCQMDEDSALVQDAYRMHAWLEEMTELDDELQPNMETYEAVMQAYVRTGTLEGVRQAERLLDSLLNDPDYRPTIRMATFHPIIAAWAHSGHDEGPSRVNQWVNTLEALSEENDIELDCRIREASLLATASKLIHLLENKNEFSDWEYNDLSDMAYGCSIHLSDICSSLTDDTVSSRELLDTQMFVLVVRAWGKLGAHYLETGEHAKEAEEAFERMMETVEEFESFVSKVSNSKRNSEHGEMQGCHLRANAFKVYSMCLSCWNGSSSLSDDSNERWTHSNQLANIEKWVRRVDEIRLQTKFRNILYGDLYSYTDRGTFLNGHCADSRAGFLLQVLEWLEEDIGKPKTKYRRGNVMRLLFVVMELFSFTVGNDDTVSQTSAYKKIVALINNLSISPEEQLALHNRVEQQLTWLQGRQRIKKIDSDLVIKEINKTSLVKRRPSRQATRGRLHRKRNHVSKRSRSTKRKASSSSHQSAKDEKKILQND